MLEFINRAISCLNSLKTRMKTLYNVKFTECAMKFEMFLYVFQSVNEIPYMTVSST